MQGGKNGLEHDSSFLPCTICFFMYKKKVSGTFFYKIKVPDTFFLGMIALYAIIPKYNKHHSHEHLHFASCGHVVSYNLC